DEGIESSDPLDRIGGGCSCCIGPFIGSLTHGGGGLRRSCQRGEHKQARKDDSGCSTGCERRLEKFPRDSCSKNHDVSSDYLDSLVEYRIYLRIWTYRYRRVSTIQTF